jgi:hypothetical protein
MFIFKEIPVKWGAVEESVKLSFNVIQAIESKGANIAVLSNDMQQKKPPFTVISVVYHELLKVAGINTDKADIYAALYGQGDGKQPSADYIISAVVEVITAAFPVSMETEKAKVKTSRK